MFVLVSPFPFAFQATDVQGGALLVVVRDTHVRQNALGGAEEKTRAASWNIGKKLSTTNR